MKKLLRLYLRETIGLFIVVQLTTGLVFARPVEDLLITGAALAVASYLVKPIINILILPLTLATLGLFKFISHAIMLYIVDVALPQFEVTGFHFQGVVYGSVSIPQVDFGKGIMAYIAFSLMISVLTSFIHWISK